jgi:hypothetical protein
LVSVPFTRQCLQNPKVRHELGQKRDISGDLEDLQHKYDDLVTAARASGLNAGVFDAMIPIAQPLSQVDNEDAHVRQLLSRKGAFSAGGLWTTCKSRIGNSNVNIRAQREQLLCEDEKAELLSRIRLEQQAKLLLNAQEAMHKYDTIGSNALNDKDWFFLFIMSSQRPKHQDNWQT